MLPRSGKVGWRSFSTIKMSFVRHGVPSSNPSLVIGHGLFGQKQNWNSSAKALARRLNTPVYCVDFRNHGESPWTEPHSYEAMTEDLARFLDEVVVPETGQKKCNILGHSMGGKVVSCFALNPEFNVKLNKLIVEDISPNRESSTSLFLKYVSALKQVDLKKPRSEILQQLESVIPELSIRQFLLTNLLREEDGFRWKMNLDSIGNSLDHILKWKVEGRTFNGPVMFLYGGKSDYFLESDKPEVLQLFPQATFKCIPEAGHWLHAEDPEKFINYVVEYLK